MKIIAYTYEAEVHCPACTRDSFKRRKATEWVDENGISDVCEDRDGNPVHPVFSTDEHNFTNCADCGAEL